MNYWDEPIWASDCSTIRPKDSSNESRFLYFQLLALSREIASLRTGAAQPHVHAKDLARLEVVTPPLAEQQRIVAVLDEAFEGITNAAATATRAIAAADDMFSSFREGLLSGQATWIDQPLGLVVSVKHGFAFESRYFGPDGEYVLLTPGNFYERGGFRDRGDAQKRYRGPVPSGFILEPNSLLVAMTEQAAGLLGSPLLVPDGEVYLHNQRLGLVQAAHGTRIDRRFLFHLFNTRVFRKHIQDSATGTKVRHTSPAKIEAFQAKLPPTQLAQENLAARIDAVLDETRALVTTHQRKLAALAELKQSILARAFSGELTRESLAA